MQQKTIIAVLLMMGSMLPAAFASVGFSEILYDPAQCPDTDCEWIEIFNNGTTPVDLSSWKLNGNDFDDAIIIPNEFVVITRKLTDPAGGTSFESVYGNNDGIWNSLDGNYKALDGNFQLPNTAGILNLSSGTTSELFSYNTSFGGNGNGKSIVKVNLDGNDSIANWAEGLVNGTPGYSEFFSSNQTPQLLTLVNISNTPPSIIAVAITPDDSPLPGVQLAPSPYANTTLTIEMNVTDGNGLADLTTATAVFGNQSIVLTKTTNANYVTYAASLSLPSLKSGFYNLTLQVADASTTTTLIIPIEILQILTISINQTTLDFGAVAPNGTSAPITIAITNTGTSATDIEVAASDLISTQNTLPAGSISATVNNQLYQLSTQPIQVPVNLNPGNAAPIAFRLTPPFGKPKSTYIGTLTIAAIAP